MSDTTGLKPRKGDLLAALLVLALAAGLSVFLGLQARGVQHTYVEIYHNGALVRELSLDTDQTFDLSGDYVNTVTVENGRIAITASTCPGSDCVHSGWADRAGQAIICLPNRIEVRLIGTTGPGNVDAIAG